ncbi:hypothetical protein TNCT_185961 [Trichonephila clavata]|uniref:Uncharacterized protein n=1 Tax=Trichonephila clavata TaxID=2740835 RepID=A0A8X6LB18_TRICU|nr:hypothetical protein TNCT_185961 [Trichonephila clavata]
MINIEGERLYGKIPKVKCFKHSLDYYKLQENEENTFEIKKQAGIYFMLKCPLKLCSARYLGKVGTGFLPKLYKPNKNITVIGQLVGFRGQCPFERRYTKQAI